MENAVDRLYALLTRHGTGWEDCTRVVCALLRGGELPPPCPDSSQTLLAAALLEAWLAPPSWIGQPEIQGAYHQCLRRLQNNLRNRGVRTQDVEALSQDILCIMWKNRQGVYQGYALAYLKRIIAIKCAEHFRLHSGAQYQASPGRISRTSHPYIESVCPDTKQCLLQEVQNLPERQRLLIELVYFEEYRISDAARIMGIGRQAAHELHAKALRHLKPRLEEKFSPKGPDKTPSCDIYRVETGGMRVKELATNRELLGAP